MIVNLNLIGETSFCEQDARMHFIWDSLMRNVESLLRISAEFVGRVQAASPSHRALEQRGLRPPYEIVKGHADEPNLTAINRERKSG